jgi:hypothetical protein
MDDDLALNLPIGEINKRLTRNARERDRLEAMLRIAVQAREDAERFGRQRPAAPQAGRANRYSRKESSS